MLIATVLSVIAAVVSADTVQITPRTWEESLSLAKAAVAKLSLAEKASLGAGLGWGNTTIPCAGGILAVEAVGFPNLCLHDSPTGLRGSYNTSAFPASINVAATFDKTLMYNSGRYMGEEFRDRGVQVQLGPVANMMRSPDGGRVWEAQGADPFLTGFVTNQVIHGIQSNGVQATLKHFVMNDQEAFRITAEPNHGNSIVDKKTMMEYYVRPFKMAIDDSGPVAIMCSYNKVNGVSACKNPAVLSILKDELGFEGYVMSDWFAVPTTSPADNGTNAGLDMIMPGSQTWGPLTVTQVNAGLINESRVDDLATRILAGWYRVRQDEGFPALDFDSLSPPAVQTNVQRDHKTHIRAVGAASSVLLRNNDNILPLKAGLKKIAIIGSDAFYPTDDINNGSYHDVIPTGTLAQGWGSGVTLYPYLVAPLDAISAVASTLNIEVTSTRENWDVSVASGLAAEADLSIVFVNSDSGEDIATVAGFPGDRLNLTLWLNGDNLIEAAAAQGPTVVVIHSPGAVDMPWISHPNISAVIMALMPGQETGNAIADVLFGSVNPSGRIPFTIGQNEADYAVRINFTNPQVEYSEGPYFDYRRNDKYSIEPLFAFGFGLSYTTFEYSNVQASVECDGPVIVSVDVKNSGSVDGNEVVQVYLGYPSDVTDQPVKQLKGFTKELIAAGDSASLSIEVPWDVISVYDVESSSWIIPQGTYTVYVGASSADIRGTAQFTTGSACVTASTSSAPIYGAATAASKSDIYASSAGTLTIAVGSAILGLFVL